MKTDSFLDKTWRVLMWIGHGGGSVKIQLKSLLAGTQKMAKHGTCKIKFDLFDSTFSY